MVLEIYHICKYYLNMGSALGMYLCLDMMVMY